MLRQIYIIKEKGISNGFGSYRIGMLIMTTAWFASLAHSGIVAYDIYQDQVLNPPSQWAGFISNLTEIIGPLALSLLYIRRWKELI